MRFQRYALQICGLLCAINLLLLGEALGSYFSDTSPTAYYEGSEMEVRVNKLASLSTPLPYSYYSLPYCHPENITDTAKNLGEMILVQNAEGAEVCCGLPGETKCDISQRTEREDGR